VLSLHADLLVEDASDAAVGRNSDRATKPGGRRTYTFFADPSLGATVAQLRDGMAPVSTLREGFYGAVVVDPASSQHIDAPDGFSAIVRPKHGRAYRDFTVFLQDGDQAIGTHRMPYTKNVDGVAAISYGSSAPLSAVTAPQLDAYAGDAVVVHVVSPASEQTQVFSVEGHTWPLEPGRDGTTHLSAVTVGGMQTLTLRLDGGAGGAARLTGDYRYGNARLPFDVAGMWGVLRVHAPSDQVPLLAHLSRPSNRPLLLFLALGFLALIGGVGVASTRMRRTKAAARPAEV